MDVQKKVSVIIRTCNRPSVLRVALESVRNQTYKDIEIVVIEDGINVSEKMIQGEYADLNIQYRATMEKKGRTFAGNLGLSVATGDYFNFLDDDDILYPEHVGTLVEVLQKSSTLAAYAIAEESQILKKRGAVIEKRKIIRYQQPFNRLLLYSFNYLPIQSVLFDRKLFDTMGGFDETLDILEDWDLWVRYSTMTDFTFKQQITSKYYVPFRGKDKKQRSKGMDAALAEVHKRFKTYGITCNVGNLQDDMKYVLNVYNQKGLLYYMKQVWNYFVYGDR